MEAEKPPKKKVRYDCMKKWISLILALVLAAAFACAGAEERTDTFFARLEGLEWTFSSGAGGWSTDMRILPDGTFSGEYHDSEMGETADAYPDGTVYCCSFTGRFSFVEQVNENTWKIHVDELKTDESAEKETIEDGMRFVYTEPYGISAGDDMLLYQPGTPVSVLSEDMQMWAHVFDNEDTIYELESWFLSSEKNQSGFVSYQVETGMSLANPWQDLSAEQLKEVSGISLQAPKDAEDVACRWMSSEKLAEIQFTWNGGDYCARAQAMALEDGHLADISGMYFQWDHEENITVGACPGTIASAKTGSEDRVERCLWYDKESGTMYSLSVSAKDLDGLDLTALAAEITQP